MSSFGATEVRSIMRLSRELREQREPTAWWRHLVRSLETLIGARAVLIAEVPPRPAVDGHPPVHFVGVDDADTARFLGGARAIHLAGPPLEGLAAVYGSQFTGVRADFVDDWRWERSEVGRELRATGCDDFLISNAPAPGHGVMSSIKLFRAPGERRFSTRDRMLLQLVHEDLASDWAGSDAVRPKLTPRQREVLACLAEGASEKQIAGSLEVSLHTVHDHVKALHRAFNVHSRGELLTRVAAENRRPRARLLAEL